MGNGRFFHLNNDGKLDLYCILKRIYPVIKNNRSVIFIECTEINWRYKYANGLCVSILLKKIVWYLSVIRKVQDNESLIYTLTGKVQNCNPIIFNKTLYHCCCK